jgi:hypothetical protein
MMKLTLELKLLVADESGHQESVHLTDAVAAERRKLAQKFYLG